MKCRGKFQTVGEVVLFLLTALFIAFAAQAGPGTALSFDGSTKYVRFPDVTHGLAHGTVEMWFNAGAWNWNTASNGLFLWSGCRGLPNSDAGDGINLGTDAAYTTNGQLMFGILQTAGGTNWQWAKSSVVPVLGTWYHVAGTWGSNGMKIYVNGSLSGTNSYTGAAPSYTSTNLLGCSTWTGSFFIGQVDELRVWNAALTQAQIQAGMNQSLLLPQTNLVAYWMFNEGVGNAVHSADGNPANFGFLNNIKNSWGASTVPFVPDAATLPPIQSTNNSAAFSASVNPNGSPTGVWFDWGTNASLGFQTSSQLIGSGSTSLVVTNIISTTNFPSGQTFCCRAMASNNSGTVEAAIEPAPPPPTSQTQEFSGNVTNDLNVTNDPGSLPYEFFNYPTVYFYGQYGPVDLPNPLVVTGAKTVEGACGSNGVTEGKGYVVANGGSLTLAYQTFMNCSSSTNGGAIAVNSGGTLTAYYCTFIGNTASGNGGAISGPGTVTLTGCTFYSNSAANGGAIDLGGSSTTLLTSCTITTNAAVTDGGAIYVESSQSGGVVTLNNCTIASNNAVSGGGVYDISGQLNLENTIVAQNAPTTLKPDVYGNQIISQGYNFIGQYSSSEVVEESAVWNKTKGDQVGGVTTTGTPIINPLLSPLGDYGGCVITMPLSPGSPAIDLGYSDGLTSDQRGFPLPQNILGLSNSLVPQGGDRSDIGAFEVQPPLTITYSYANETVTLSWSVNANIYGGYILESSPSLSDQQWAPATGGTYSTQNDLIMYSFPNFSDYPPYYTLKPQASP